MVSTYPPRSVLSAILRYSIWPEIPSLKGISHAPLVIGTGEIVATPGYHAASQMYVRSTVNIGDCAGATRDNARNAANILCDLIKDFPFEVVDDVCYGPSVWMSLVLTLVTRHLFDGPTPLFMFDANKPATGKTILVQLAAIIVHGSMPEMSAAPTNDDEARKRLLALTLESVPLHVMDNSRGVFGTPAIEMAITSGKIRDRVLGVSQTASGPFKTVLALTGNNISVTGDMTRRICGTRLETELEHPEDRDDFDVRNILDAAQRRRAEFLQAALTMVAAYLRAGSPDVGLSPWGSFESWSAIVRGAIVWAGLPDPAIGQRVVKERGDVRRECVSEILSNWEAFAPLGELKTLSDLVRLAAVEDRHLGDQEPIADAIRRLVHPVTAKALSFKLRDFRDQLIDGRKLVHQRRGGKQLVDCSRSDDTEGPVMQGDLRRAAIQQEVWFGRTPMHSSGNRIAWNAWNAWKTHDACAFHAFPMHLFLRNAYT